MTQNNISVKPILYTHAGSHGRHPVKIRITSQRQTVYFSVFMEGNQRLHLTKEEWRDFIADPSSRRFQTTRDLVFKAEVTAREDAISALEKGLPLKKSKSETVNRNKNAPVTFFGYFERYITELENDDRFSTASSYQNSLNSFKLFRKEIDLYPAELTTKMLKDFEAFHKARNLTKATIGIYARCMRTIFNYAIEDNPKLAPYYPFARSRSNKSKYRIKEGSGKKGDAMDLVHLKKFIAYNPPALTPMWLAHRIWLFSFYSHGMNFKDIALLRWKNINEDKKTISYVRKKTENTEMKEELLVIPINGKIQNILGDFSPAIKDSDQLVFGLIDQTEDKKKLSRAIKNKTGNINKWLKYISRDLGILSCPEIG